MCENRGNKHPGKTRFARRRFYTVVGHLFFKFDEMRLRLVFTIKTTVILPKSIAEFVFNRNQQLYTGRAGGSSKLSQCVSRGIVVVNACGKSRVRFRAEPVSLLLFSSFFSFPLRLVFFLVIVVLFCFSI